jgi:hypothetical protein
VVSIPVRGNSPDRDLKETVHWTERAQMLLNSCISSLVGMGIKWTLICVSVSVSSGLSFRHRSWNFHRASNDSKMTPVRNCSLMSSRPVKSRTIQSESTR